MIKTKLLICAEEVIVDQKSNNASVINIIEQFTFTNLPAVINKMVIMSLLERDEGDDEKWEGRLRMFLAGVEIFNQPIIHNFKGMPRSRHIFGIGGIPISQPGKMEICLYKGNDRITSYSIDIVSTEKPAIKEFNKRKKSRTTESRA